MPGLLKKMSSSGVDGAIGPRDGENKKRNHEGNPVTNGQQNVIRKDTSPGSLAVNGPVSQPVINGASMSVSAVPAPMSAAAQIDQLPPEIAHLTSEFYHPLSTMLLRISQGCYNDLTEVLQRMADLPSHQANGVMTNGLGPHAMANGGQDNSELSKQKKLLLMRFAQENRAKFIKLAVLAEWGKKSSTDVSKLIDLFSWAKEQSNEMDKTDWQLEQIKILSNNARQLNPDIRTALEILATKKAGWIPDMGYIPPQPISSDKALKLLRYMDTSLTIRLKVHEDLPQYLENWRVNSGRVTFIIDNEFEFDLMSWTEDASEPWVFIDLRLLFSPAPSIETLSRFMGQLKGMMDESLRNEGLNKSFRFLYSFVLTHKINMLRSQAYELLRTGWAGSLGVHQAHRVLSIQYWTEKPGKKNWIQIGISSNKPKGRKNDWRGQPLPCLTMRWFRQGEEVEANLNFDWRNLSMERMIKHIISLHIGHLLETTQQNLSLDMTVKATFSQTEPSECKLEACIGSPANKTILSVEPVTGRYIFQPVTPLSSSAENATNRPQEALNTGNIITQLLARSLLDRVQRCAQELGWQQLARQALRLDVVKTAVQLDVIQYAFYWPRGWSPNWALAAVVNVSGESWWICELGSRGTSIEFAQRIVIDKADNQSPPLNRSTLSSIERVAVHTLAFYVTSQALRNDSKTFRLGNDFAQPRHPAASQRIVHGWVLHVKTSDLLATKPGEKPWLEPSMRIMCQGLRLHSHKIWHIASGTMVPDVVSDMKKLMSASPQSNFSISDGGHFSILLSTPFGRDMIGELKARLHDVDRLRSFATTLTNRKMVLMSSSLQQVTFQYGKSLTATVKFTEGDSIHLEFGTIPPLLSNPHKRIKKFLDEMVNERSPVHADLDQGDKTGLDRLCTTLMFTRPILSALSEIETERAGNFNNPAVYPRASGWYRVAYGNPTCSFDVRLRAKNDRTLWLIEDNEGKPPDFRPKDERSPNFKRSENLKTALQKLFKESGEKWYGVRTGIVAEIDGIPIALKRLHGTVMSCHVEGQVKQEPSDNKATVTAVPKQQLNGQVPTTKSGAGLHVKQEQRKASNVGGKSAMRKGQEVIELD